MIEHFHRPATIREALALKRRLRERAVYLAGGTHVNSSESRERAQHAIDLAGLGLDRITRDRGRVVLGAGCTLQQLVDDRRVPAALKAALAQVVSRNVRNAGTLGGHLAARRPVSDVLPMLVALEAKVVLSRPGATRTLAVAEYVARPVAGLIRKVILPKAKAGRSTACRNLRGSSSGRSLVSAAVSAGRARGTVRDPIVALSGAGHALVRLAAVERALHGRPLPPLDELQALAGRAVHPGAGLAGSAAFLRHEAGAVVALALRDALAGKGARA
jgi:putative selenate reductase FAD-binding subunit